MMTLLPIFVIIINSHLMTDGKHTETSTHDPMGGGTSFFSDFNEELPLSPPSTPMSTVTSGVTEVIFPGGFDSRNEKFQTGN